jgi:hypothetical protein
LCFFALAVLLVVGAVRGGHINVGGLHSKRRVFIGSLASRIVVSVASLFCLVLGLLSLTGGYRLRSIAQSSLLGDVSLLGVGVVIGFAALRNTSSVKTRSRPNSEQSTRGDMAVRILLNAVALICFASGLWGLIHHLNT